MHNRGGAFEDARKGASLRARFRRKNGKFRPETLPVEPRRGVTEPVGDRPIHFPRGLLGFPNRRDFALVEWNRPEYSRFKLLQSLSDRQLCFVVLPLASGSDLIEREDLEAACMSREIPLSHLLVLLIVSARPNGGAIRLSANLRAPLLVDAGRARGVQHVLENEKYQVRHAISL